MDIDLTICDNTKRRLEAFRRGLGRELTQRERELIILERYDQILKDKQSSQRVIQSFLYDPDLFELDSPLQGSVPVLRWISQNHRLFYVSGRPLKHTIQDFLIKYGFPQAPIFNAPVLPQQGYKKQELFSRVIEYAGTNRGAAVGDLIWDAIAAKRLGLYAIGTCQAKLWARAQLEKVCDYVIEHISQLIPVLMELEERIK